MKKLTAEQERKITLAIGESLEKQDWNVWERKSPCTKCKKKFVEDGKYCSECGHKLPKIVKLSPAFIELWNAFEAGLKVYDKLCNKQ